MVSELSLSPFDHRCISGSDEVGALVIDIGSPDDVLAYRRGDAWWVVLNFGDTDVDGGVELQIAICSAPSTPGLVGARVRSVPPHTAVIAHAI